MTLAEYLASSETTRLDFARRLKVTDSAVSRWASGLRCPSVSLAFAIERESKGAVPASSWQPTVRTPPAKRKVVVRRRASRSARRPSRPASQ